MYTPNDKKLTAGDAIRLLTRALEVKSRPMILNLIASDSKELMPDWDKESDATYQAWEELVNQALDFLEDSR